MRRSVLVGAGLCIGLLAGCGESTSESFPAAPSGTISVVQADHMIQVTLNSDGKGGPVMAPGVTLSGGGESGSVMLVVRKGPAGPMLRDWDDQVGVGESLPKIALTAPGPYSFRLPPAARGKAELCATVTRGIEEKAVSELACERITITP